MCKFLKMESLLLVAISIVVLVQSDCLIVFLIECCTLRRLQALSALGCGQGSALCSWLH